MSVEGKHLSFERVHEQQNIVPLRLPRSAPIKRKLSNQHQISPSPKHADDEERQKYCAPRRKRRKRFLKNASDDQTTPSQEVIVCYDDESDFAEVFDSSPSASLSTSDAGENWFSLNAMSSQDAATSANGMDGYDDMTLIVVQLVSNMQNFTFKGTVKSPKLHNRKKRKARD